MLDRFNALLGRTTAWLTLVMVIVTFIIVVLRYAFDVGLIWLQEMVVWMHALVFMAGAAYTLERDEHVRVDIFYRRLSPQGRALVNFLGVIVFLLPLCAFLAWKSFDFVMMSFRLHEASRESGGLPYPLVPLLKSFLLLMPLTIGLQGVALLMQSVRTMRGR